jgi:hypothetical protein
MVHAQTLDFVKRDEHPRKEQLVLFLQWQSKPVDYRTENLEKLGDTVEALRLVDELKEDVVDGSADVGAKVEEFAVYAMKCSLQEVAFSGVFRVEKLKQLVTLAGCF